jgi:hypothetical protein
MQSFTVAGTDYTVKEEKRQEFHHRDTEVTEKAVLLQEYIDRFHREIEPRMNTNGLE